MEPSIFLFLGKYGTEAKNAGICLQCEGFVKCRVGQHWHLGELLLECFKCRVASLSPKEFNSLPSQCMEWLGHLGELGDESPIVRAESKESANFLNLLRSWKILDCGYDPWIGLEALWSNYVSQILHSPSDETALGRLKL